MRDTKACWPNHLDCDHREYIGRSVTLNEAPATIVKDKEGWPFVAPLDTSTGSVPYSWTAIFNICDNHGGRFEVGG